MKSRMKHDMTTYNRPLNPSARSIRSPLDTGTRSDPLHIETSDLSFSSVRRSSSLPREEMGTRVVAISTGGSPSASDSGWYNLRKSGLS